MNRRAFMIGSAAALTIVPTAQVLASVEWPDHPPLNTNLPGTLIEDISSTQLEIPADLVDVLGHDPLEFEIHASHMWRQNVEDQQFFKFWFAWDKEFMCVHWRWSTKRPDDCVYRFMEVRRTNEA